IPITYESLAKIATLAGQLGVPADRIAAFTETVAKTSAVTDLSVEQAATAFGRLDALIPNVRGQYDRLGSSIAKVGVNSVATESEIVNISTQISSMGSFAGLTAQDIIGLSGALASVGAQPELSRGTITRVFTVMSRAVASGGDALDRFAEISGVSSAEFAATWGTDAFSGTFLKFMDGIKAKGGDAVGALNELGITSVRDVPLLLRLANAADSTGKAGALLAQTIGDANQGWAENIELQRQYEIIAGTVAAKTEVLVNNFNLFLQALGAPMLQSLGDVIDLMTDLTKTATDFVASDFGGSVARTVVVLTALLGVLALAAGAMALMGASSIGVYQALLFLSAQSPVATAAILGTAGAAKLADGSLKASAASATAFSRALKALSLIGLALVLPDLLTSGGNAIADQVDKVTGATRDWSTALKRLSEDTAFFGASGFDIKSNPLANFFLTVPWDQTTRDLQFLNDELEKTASLGDFGKVAAGLTEISKASGQSLEQIIGGSELEKILDGAQVKMRQLADGTIELVNAQGGATGSTTDVAEAIATMEANAEAAQGALDEMKQALDEIAGTQISASAAADQLQSAMNRAWEQFNEGGIAIDGLDDKSIAFRDTLRDMEQKARDAGVAVAENGGDTEQAVGSWQRGRDSIIDMLTAMLGSRDAAVAWADQNLGSAGEVASALDGVTKSVNNIPKNPHINLTAETWGAQAAIEDFINRNNGRSLTIYQDIVTSSATNWQIPKGVKRAGGGSVWGPGTATSDSILAHLSNGEFVIRTQAAKAIGYGKLDYANRYGKLPAFAGGGQVGGGGGGQTVSSEIDLGPRTMRALSRQVVNMIAIDQNSIADAANAGNARGAWRGGKRR
ncbi:MAG TPA: phage tail tape measure protein, partial [Mycobacterium sp.]|nr:phage tail tape measure protein [Mycobacterium sp.]